MLEGLLSVARGREGVKGREGTEEMDMHLYHTLSNIFPLFPNMLNII